MNATLALLLLVAIGIGLSTAEAKPLQVIVDTDIGPWPDDVGALSILHTFADQHRVKILAILSNNAYDGAVAVIDAMDTYFNRSDIPIGITKDPHAMRTVGDFGWPKYMLEHFPHPHYQNNSQAEDAVALYRKILGAAADKSVTIVSLGYMTNLAHLLNTTGDEHSKLNGRDLVAAKVDRMVCMAGLYPSGLEYNIKDQPKAAQEALPDFPTPVTFIGFEAGDVIMCGGNLLNSTTNDSILANSPVSKAFELTNRGFGQLDGCYDELAAYLVVEGIAPFYELVPGQIEIATNGTNTWIRKPTHHVDQAYVKQIHPSDTQKIINALNPLLAR